MWNAIISYPLGLFCSVSEWMSKANNTPSHRVTWAMVMHSKKILSCNASPDPLKTMGSMSRID